MRALLASMLLLIQGCEDAEQGVNSVPAKTIQTVKEACEQRTRAASEASCVSCRIVAQQDPCGCELLQEGAGACLAQASARRGEASCTEALEGCVASCAPQGCGCEEACYAQADGCRRATLALESCLASACATRCP